MVPILSETDATVQATAPAAEGQTEVFGERQAETLAALLSLPWLTSVPRHDLHLLASCTRLRVARKGELLISQGQPADRLCILLTGRAHAERIGPAGRRVLLELLRPGDRIGDLGLLDGGPHAASVHTVQASRVLEVSRRDFFHCLDLSVALRDALAVAMVQRLRRTNQRIQRLALNTVVERVYLQLSESARERPDGKRVVGAELSRLELARLVGASREMVSRAVRRLCADGRVQTLGRRALLLN